MVKGLRRSIELWEFIMQRRRVQGETSRGEHSELGERRITLVNEEMNRLA